MRCQPLLNFVEELTVMLDHTGIGVADVARSAAFYDAALGARFAAGRAAP